MPKKIMDFEHPTPWGKLAPKIYTTWGNHPAHLRIVERLGEFLCHKIQIIIAHTIFL